MFLQQKNQLQNVSSSTTHPPHQALWHRFFVFPPCGILSGPANKAHKYLCLKALNMNHCGKKLLYLGFQLTSQINVKGPESSAESEMGTKRPITLAPSLQSQFQCPLLLPRAHQGGHGLQCWFGDSSGGPYKVSGRRSKITQTG